MPDFRLLRCLTLAATLTLAGPASAGSYDDILVAADQDRTAEVIDLLQRGMDVNTTDRQGNTLLIIAARNGNIELLDFLLRNRANTSRRNQHGDSAIMAAAFRGNVAILQRLLLGGAIVDNAGWNALHYAAYGGHNEIMRALVAATRNLDALAPNGQTALMFAAAAGKLDVVKTLVDADADMDLKDPEGRTALALALANEQTLTAAYLRESGADED